MKVIFENTVNERIRTLFTQFQISEAMDKEKLNKLIKSYRQNDDRISYEDTENGLACIYLLQKYGIPIKGSAECLRADYRKTLKLLRYTNTTSYSYVMNFINFLTRFDDAEFKSLFLRKFEKFRHESPDPFILAIALNSKMREGDRGFRQSENLFGYSETSIVKYKEIIGD